MTDSATISARHLQDASRGSNGSAQPMWMQEDNFPRAPRDGSFGFVIGPWQRKRSFEALARRVSSGALGLGGLVWTPHSNRVLPAWDDPLLAEFSWKASRRFWIGLSILSLMFAGYDFSTLMGNEGAGLTKSLIGDLFDLSCSSSIVIFCLWQLVRAFRKSPSYLLSAKHWQHFNAWSRLNAGVWTELLMIGLLIVRACQDYGLRSIDGNGIALRTVKLAVGFQGLFIDRQWWRLFTAPVVHGNAGHLLVNLIWLLFAARWVRGISPRAVLPMVLCVCAWAASSFVLLGPLAKPAVGLSGGLFGLNGFVVAAWLRTRSLPPFLGIGLLLWTFTGAIGEWLQGPDASNMAAGHAGGFLVGFLLGLMLVRPGAQLPITTNRFVNVAGNACGAILLVLCVVVSLNLAGVSWAQW